MCLLSVEKGQAVPVEPDSLKRELLDTNKCYLLDCGLEVFVWMGRNTSLDDRKSASAAAEVIILKTNYSDFLCFFFCRFFHSYCLSTLHLL